MADYKIISTEFSIKTEIESDSKVNDGQPQPYKRISYLVVSVSFNYELYGKIEIGAVTSIVSPICTVSFNANNKAIKIDEGKLPTKAEIDKIIDDLITAEINDILIVSNERTYLDTSLNKVKAYGWEERFENHSSYSELDDYNTGIGAYPTNNFLEL